MSVLTAKDFLKAARDTLAATGEVYSETHVTDLAKVYAAKTIDEYARLNAHREVTAEDVWSPEEGYVSLEGYVSPEDDARNFGQWLRDEEPAARRRASIKREWVKPTLTEFDLSQKDAPED